MTYKTKDTMKAFVDKAQPVIQEIKRVHNEFIRLQYFAFSPEDLYEEYGTIDFIKDNKHNLFSKGPITGCNYPCPPT